MKERGEGGEKRRRIPPPTKKRECWPALKMQAVQIDLERWGIKCLFFPLKKKGGGRKLVYKTIHIHAEKRASRNGAHFYFLLGLQFLFIYFKHRSLASPEKKIERKKKKKATKASPKQRERSKAELLMSLCYIFIRRKVDEGRQRTMRHNS